MGEMGQVGGRDTAEVGPFPEHPIDAGLHLNHVEGLSQAR
jgi:hypothetical protein